MAEKSTPKSKNPTKKTSTKKPAKPTTKIDDRKSQLTDKPKTFKPATSKLEIVGNFQPTITAKKQFVKKEIDYDLDFDQGNLADGYEMWRSKVVSNGLEVRRIGEVFVSCGFGQTKQKAVEDFINRNSSDILNKIFDKEAK